MRLPVFHWSKCRRSNWSDLKDDGEALEWKSWTSSFAELTFQFQEKRRIHDFDELNLFQILSKRWIRRVTAERLGLWERLAPFRVAYHPGAQ